MKTLKIPTAFPLRGLGFFLGFLLLFCLTACTQDVEPATTSVNHFSCYLNGKLWKPSKKEPGFNTLWASPEGNGYLTINASYRDDNRFEGITLFSINVFGEGDYPIKRELNNRIGFRDYPKKIDITSHDLDVIHEGVLTITKFDMEKGIVAGTFWFRLEKQGIEPIEAKDGKFSIGL